jgi:hypothetical protein
LNESLDSNQAFLTKIKEAISQKNSQLADKTFKSSTSTAKSSVNVPVKSDVVAEKSTKIIEAVVDPSDVIPVLMFACNRVTVNLALDSLLKARKDPKKFPIIVSQVTYVLKVPENEPLQKCVAIFNPCQLMF